MSGTEAQPVSAASATTVTLVTIHKTMMEAMRDLDVADCIVILSAVAEHTP
jgi:hypothetical protein